MSNKDLWMHIMACITLSFVVFLFPVVVGYFAVSFISAEWMPINIFEWHTGVRVVVTVWFIWVAFATIMGIAETT